MTTGVVASTTPTEMNARLVTSGGLSAGECYNAGLILTAAILCSLVCGGLAWCWELKNLYENLESETLKAAACTLKSPVEK